MANESPLVHLGWLLSTGDYRNSTLSGTTHAGPNGSAQFQCVHITSNGTVGLSTASGQAQHGILQNKPNAGEAADMALFGVSKVVAGSTSLTAGSKFMADSSGLAIPYTTGLFPMGIALETPTAVGQVISALLNGNGIAVGS